MIQNVHFLGGICLDRERLITCIRQDGTLDTEALSGREILYRGRNGKVVERFYVETESGRESFIFKPLTNPETLGREAWLHGSLLTEVPVRHPRLLASADHQDPDRYWTIFEDVGMLSHALNGSDFAAAAALIPHWHKLTPEAVPRHFIGDKPSVERVLRDVGDNWNKLEDILTGLGLQRTIFKRFKGAVGALNGVFATEQTVCHGDYHLGNIAKRDDGFIILDWEHMHVNSLYWDLYNLLDMSHPRFRKRMNGRTRRSALEAYVAQRSVSGWSPVSDFYAEYYLYAAIHSAWMVLLIDSDMAAGRWEVSELLASLHETNASLQDCLSELFEYAV
jgi:hypothetical protein